MSSVAATALVCVPLAATAQDGFAQSAEAGEFARFAPGQGEPIATTLDYSIWDAALNWFVLNMGRSLREFSSRPEAQSGSHITYGHDSPYRLEGNRVAFSMMPDEVKQSLTDYRRDLEQLPDQIQLTRLSRNEQLAFWINLHNVAVIEQLAFAYPVESPSRLLIGAAKIPLDEAPIITVGGVRMSPKDIRTKIVYPSWRDPKVMYGFWRGEIGGPSINRAAFTGANLGKLLDEGAREFVNSLRGAERRGDTLYVSRHYLEAQPFFFSNFEGDLRAHLRKYGKEDVVSALDGTSSVSATLAELDIADLSKGERAPNYSNIVIPTDRGDKTAGVKIDASVARLMNERGEKLEKIWRENGRQGRVIFQDVGEAAKPAETVE